MTAPALPPLPDDVAQALPTSTPPPPWTCRVEAVVWWHRAGPHARAALAPGLRAGLPLTVGAALRYLDSPVGPYEEVLAAPLLLRGAGLVHVTVPFIAVDSVASIAGGREHWGLPKVPAAFRRDGDDGGGAPDGALRVEGGGWSLTAAVAARGPALPLAARFSSTQDGVLTARSSVRSRARLARVTVDGEGLPPWLRPGRHAGAVLSQARLVVGAPR